MIQSFSCKNFRNISCDNLEFKRINIMIGPNNAGKSNFIRALSFSANMVNNPKTESTGFLTELKRNGWHHIANKRSASSDFFLNWKLELDKDRPVAYTLRANVGSHRNDNFITEESLDSTEMREGVPELYNFFKCHTSKPGKGQFSKAGFSSEKNKLIFADVDRSETVLLQMDNLFFQNKEMFSAIFVRDKIRTVLESMRTYFKGFYSYSCTAFNLSAIREMRDEQSDGSFLMKDGSNFVNVFANMEAQDDTFHYRFLSMLQKQVCNCEGIEVMRAGGKVWMELKIDGCQFSLSEVSDGTIHLLVLLLMLNLSSTSGISLLAIDEPEMNLHPAWQKQLAHDILRCNSFKQCFVSTHSPDFLDEFTEDFCEGNVAVFVFDPVSRTPIRKLNYSELQADLNDWTLGDLYRVGDPLIGGWPQ